MVRVACVATFSLSFLLLAVSVPCAGTATDAARSSGAGQFSFLAWLHSLTHSANHRRIASSPSLPRPRPSHLEPAPNASSKAPPIYD